MYAKGKQKPTVGPVVERAEPYALTSKPKVVDVLSMMKDWSQVQSHNICFVF